MLISILAGLLVFLEGPACISIPGLGFSLPTFSPFLFPSLSFLSLIYKIQGGCIYSCTYVHGYVDYGMPNSGTTSETEHRYEI